jgi:hypothetical protein
VETKTVTVLPKELSGIPIEVIDLSFEIYKKMKQIKIPFFQDIDWMRELEGIERCLTRLAKRRFLTQRQSRIIMRRIYEVLDKSDKAPQRLASRYLKNKRGAPEDKPFNFLIFMLVRQSVRFTGKKRFATIADLLRDREGIYITADDLRKRYSRLSQEGVRDTLYDYGIADPKILKAVGPLMNTLFSPFKRLLSPELRQRLMNNQSP